MSDQSEASKIHVDSDWKAQAQAEKEKLAQKVKDEQEKGGGAAGGPGGGAPGQLPPATFETLVSTMVTQALFALGAIPDPRTGQRFENLDLARHHIELLSVIEEKTKGNLSEEESKMLSTTIYELRTRYIQMASAPRTA